MISMNKMFKLVLIFLFDLIDVNESLLSVGKYPDYESMDVNLPHCGLNHLAHVFTISYDRHCFRFSPPYITVTQLLDSEESVSSRVWKGTDVPYGEAPWVVYLDSYDTILGITIRSEYCTGVLVTFEWVLTAAHCLKFESMTVSAGDIKHNGYEKIEANKMIKHPLYGEDQLYDIALVKTESKFTRYSVDGSVYRINPICLPGANQTIEMVWDRVRRMEAGQNATFYGFGVVNDDNDWTEKLQKGVASVYTCDSFNLMFCARHRLWFDEPKICLADSGGPVVQYVEEHRAVLLGVVSKFFDPVNDPGKCSQSTKTFWSAVPQHIDWILDTISTN